jgi:hypothetical protein
MATRGQSRADPRGKGALARHSGSLVGPLGSLAGRLLWARLLVHVWVRLRFWSTAWLIKIQESGCPR